MSTYAKLVGRLQTPDGLTIDISVNISDAAEGADTVATDILDMLNDYVQDMDSADQLAQQTMDRLTQHASPFLRLVNKH